MVSKKSTKKPAGSKAAPGGRQGSAKADRKEGPVEVLSSSLSYEGPLFRVYTDQIRERGVEFPRDVIRHHGSAVILALDSARSRKDPLLVIERQYRHAAGQYLLEVPAGKLEEGEKPLEGAKRELLEETGFRARRWRKLLRFFPSPGFLGEAMQVFVAEGLVAGGDRPDYDEQLEVMMLPLSKVLRLIEQGKIIDGKTILSVLFYARGGGRA